MDILTIFNSLGEESFKYDEESFLTLATPSNVTAAPTRKICYCDPSVKRGFDCNESACAGISALFLILFFVAMVEGWRRVYVQRKYWMRFSFLATLQLTIASTLSVFRMILLLAKVNELYSLGTLYLFGFGFLVTSYLTILLAWCDLMISVNFSTVIQKIFPVVRAVLIILIIIHYIGWTIAMAIYWPGKVTNIFMGIYCFGVGIAYISIGWVVYKEFKKVTTFEPNCNSVNIMIIKSRMMAVGRLSIGVVFSAFLFAIVLICVVPYWKIKSNEQMVGLLFVIRLSMIIFNYSMLVTTKPISDQQMRKNATSKSPKGSNNNQAMTIDGLSTDVEMTVSPCSIDPELIGNSQVESSIQVSTQISSSSSAP